MGKGKLWATKREEWQYGLGLSIGGMLTILSVMVATALRGDVDLGGGVVFLGFFGMAIVCHNQLRKHPAPPELKGIAPGPTLSQPPRDDAGFVGHGLFPEE